MRFFYDTEFIEDGRTIDLVSIGVVAEDGREYYAISTEFNPDAAGPWVRANVLPKLPSPGSSLWKSRATIRRELLEFFTAPTTADQATADRGSGYPAPIELWAWVAAYDHVALCQLWGDMTELPRPIPRFTRELKQTWEERGRPPLPAAPADAHDALADARHNLAKWQTITA